MTTTVTFRGRNAYPVNVQVGLAGEYNVSRVYFEPPATGVYNLFVTFADGSADVFDVTNDGLWVIDTDVTRHPGKATAYLQVTDGEVALWKSKDFSVMIEAVGDIDDDLEKQYPSAMTQALVQVHEDMEAAGQSAKDAKDEADRAKDEADRAYGGAERAEGFADAALDYVGQATTQAGLAEGYAEQALTQAGLAKGYAEQAQSIAGGVDSAVSAGVQALQDKTDQCTTDLEYATTVGVQALDNKTEQCYISIDNATSTGLQALQSKADELVSSSGTIGTAVATAEFFKTAAVDAAQVAVNASDSAGRNATDALNASSLVSNAVLQASDHATAAAESARAAGVSAAEAANAAEIVTDNLDEALAEVERVRDSIPTDYTTLSGSVAQLVSGYEDHETRIDALEQGGGSGDGLSAEMKTALAGMIKNEIVYVSTSHPYADTLIALLESSTPEEPEPPTEEVVLTGITVVWSADSAPKNSSVYNIITSVSGVYSDGTTKPVTDYTVVPSVISEGENTVIVSYNGKTSTKTIIGVAPQFTPHNVDPTSLTWERGYINASGAVQSGAAQGMYSSSKFDVEGASHITLSIIANNIDYTVTASDEAKIAFYDVNSNFIERIIRTNTCAINGSAKYCRITWGAGIIGNGGWDGTGATISLT